MGLVLRELLDVDQITALAVSVSMDYAKRRDLMNSLAALKLSQSKVAYNDAMSAISGLSKERNAIIHGLYGYIDGQDVRLNINNRGSFTGTENKESVNRIM